MKNVSDYKTLDLINYRPMLKKIYVKFEENISCLDRNLILVFQFLNPS